MTSSMLKIDDRQLILEVAKYGELYNQNHKKFKDQDRREDVWEEVSSVIRRPADECRARWKCLRDTFVKTSKVKPDGKQKVWRFSRIMQFVAPFINFRSPHGQNTPRHPVCERSQSMVHEGNDEMGEQTDEQTSNAATLDNTSSRSTDAPPALPTPPPQPLLLHIPHDEDQLFVLSLVPGLKRLSAQQKSLMKIRMLQMVHEAQFPCANQTNTSGSNFYNNVLVTDQTQTAYVKYDGV